MVEYSGKFSPEPDSHISSEMLSTLSILKCLGFWIFHILEYLHIVKENLGDGTGVYSIYKLIYVSYIPYVHNPREINSVFSIILCMKQQSRNSEFLRVSNFQIRGAQPTYLCGQKIRNLRGAGSPWSHSRPHRKSKSGHYPHKGFLPVSPSSRPIVQSQTPHEAEGDLGNDTGSLAASDAEHPG